MIVCSISQTMVSIVHRPMKTMLPDTMAPETRSAIDEAVRALRDLYGDRLRHVVLFGSQARNEAHAESDVDLLIVLKDQVDYAREARRMLDIYVAALRNHHIVLSLIPVPDATFRSAANPLMMNIHREGAFV
jgi:predicted nucleotidyltransferase